MDNQNLNFCDQRIYYLSYRAYGLSIAVYRIVWLEAFHVLVQYIGSPKISGTLLLVSVYCA
jgi:hypothetical protein